MYHLIYCVSYFSRHLPRPPCYCHGHRTGLNLFLRSVLQPPFPKPRSGGANFERDSGRAPHKGQRAQAARRRLGEGVETPYISYNSRHFSVYSCFLICFYRWWSVCFLFFLFADFDRRRWILKLFFFVSLALPPTPLCLYWYVLVSRFWFQCRPEFVYSIFVCGCVLCLKFCSCRFCGLLSSGGGVCCWPSSCPGGCSLMIAFHNRRRFSYRYRSLPGQMVLLANLLPYIGMRLFA